MNHLLPAQIAPFLKRFAFKGGVLRRIRIQHVTPRDSVGEIIVAVREAANNQRVRLRLVLAGVEEFRFQRRPGPGLVRLQEVRIGAFNGLIYLNLDAYADDVAPAIHDFRASDAFIAGRTLSWEFVPPKTAPVADSPGSPNGT